MPPNTPRTRGRPPKYSTPEERAQARLLQTRQNLQRYRNRKKTKQASFPLTPTDTHYTQQQTIDEPNINEEKETRSVVLFHRNSQEFSPGSSESDSSSSRTTSPSATGTIISERLRIHQKIQSRISPVNSVWLPTGKYF